MSEEASPEMNMEDGGVENQSPDQMEHQHQEMESPGANMEGGDMEGGAEYGCKNSCRLKFILRRGHGRRYEWRRRHGS
jgi:hypothetical protein